MNHPFSRSGSVLLLLALALAGRSVPATAQTPGWAVNLSSARASVNIGDYAAIWGSDTVTAVWARPDVGGWVATAERGERNGIVDFAVGTRGYKHFGAWTLAGGASATPNSHFLPAATAEGEISRRFGTLVPSAGYRYLGFQSADIHQIQPALTWYHARGDVEARVFLTRNMTTQRETGSALLRTTFAFTPRLTVGGGAATGDRIFDVASLPYGAARAHLGFAEVHVGVTTHDFIQVGATVANEQPGFTYRAFTLGYRRTF